jgi:hypothetical protein
LASLIDKAADPRLLGAVAPRHCRVGTDHASRLRADQCRYRLVDVLRVDDATDQPLSPWNTASSRRLTVAGWSTNPADAGAIVRALRVAGPARASADKT